jgi:transketolase
MKTRDVPKLPLDDVTASDAVCQVLCEMAERDSSLWVLTADVMRTTKTQPFAKAFPDRFLNVGIAEQCMVGIAAGLATCGKVPIATAFAAMLSMRACEQIRTDLAYANLNVKIIASAAGFAAGYAGPTHHATEDIAILRAMANMTVIVPCDARETREAVRAALGWPGPVYIRIGGRGNDYTVYAETLDYQIGRAVVVRDGTDVTFISCGRTVAECVVASELLQREGIQARVLDMHTVKPIDVMAVQRAASQTRMVFTVEDHNVVGGLGGAVAEVMAELKSSAPLKRLGIPDTYAVIGSTDALLDRYGLTGPRLADTVMGSLRLSATGGSGHHRAISG